ncbi:MAG: 4Fe-4S dicluster domain-containing protein [Pseudomonadota bacterium]
MTESTDASLATLLPPRLAAERAAQNYRMRPTTLVTYISSGRLLIVGCATDIDELLGQLPVDRPTAVLLNDSCSSRLAKQLHGAGIAYVEQCADIEVSGYFGAFIVSAVRRGERFETGTLPASKGAFFDLVLDLNRPPVHPAALPPVGYFAPAGDPQRLADALTDLADLNGEFDKPKFFDFKQDLCAHSSSGVRGCRKCLDACATGAISSENGTIRVNPYLCQGCGDCATVCPSGAMNYAFPGRADNLNRIRLMLRAFMDAGGVSPILLLHDSGAGKRWLDAARASLSESLIPYEVEALGAVGIEVWLAAIAYGAAGVMLLKAEPFTPHSERSLRAEITHAGEILHGLGFHQFIRVVVPEPLVGEPGVPYSAVATIPPANFSGQDDKRAVVRMAVDHLAAHAATDREHVDLSPDAPFGALRVDPRRCTLCMACVTVCPASALADGKDRPQLRFIEANCVQCGVCVNGCPENAITLVPRYRYDSVKARHTVLLHAEPVFACIRCGKPFATQSMIRTITAKLQNHPMFQGENRERLMMCDECRIKEMF